jgi:hypothetical protein
LTGSTTREPRQATNERQVTDGEWTAAAPGGGLDSCVALRHPPHLCRPCCVCCACRLLLPCPNTIRKPRGTPRPRADAERLQPTTCAVQPRMRPRASILPGPCVFLMTRQAAFHASHAKHVSHTSHTRHPSHYFVPCVLYDA